MHKSSSGAKKRRENGRHNPLATDIESDRTHGVRLKRPLNNINPDEESDDEREVRLI
jgi:hypothetical protein